MIIRLKEVGRTDFSFPTTGFMPARRLVFTRDANQAATQVEAASVVFKRRRLDGEGGKTFRIKPRRSVDEIRAEVAIGSAAGRAG